MAKKDSRSKRSGDAGLDLASAFPAASEEAWRGLVGRILGDRDFAETLVRKTYDGIAIQPLYTGKDWPAEAEASGFPGLPPFTRGHRVTGQAVSGWDIRQCHVHPDPSRCNDAILEDLGRGVTSIDLRLDLAGRRGQDSNDGHAAKMVGVGGVMVACIGDLDRALKGVHIDACPVGMHSGAAFLPAAAMMFGLVQRRGVAREAFLGALNADPLGALAELGGLTTSTRDALTQLGSLARYVAQEFPAATAVAVDASGYHDAGASEGQELACAVATGTAYLRAMAEAGLDMDSCFRQIAFTFATDANLFLSIAKLRAARRLWSRVAEACGVPQAVREMRLHAVTSGRMLAKRDPWVNILRGTVATLAASAAGADSITVLPFTAAIGVPDPAALRIARNTQLVLQQESSLNRVIDPAGGAWAIENLTEAMAREAWKLFQAIESEGGMPAALERGSIQARIAAVAAQRAGRVAALAEPLTGTSAFPDVAERPVPVDPVDLPKLRAQAISRLKKSRGTLVKLAAVGGAASWEPLVAGALAGASLAELGRVSAKSAPAVAEPLPRQRLGEPFEALRDASDAYLERTGKRPNIFLATIGSLAAYAAAVSYTRNLLAAGGIEAETGDGGSDPAAIAKAFQRSGADIAVICSDKAGYREIGADLAGALAKAGARKIYVAGRPPEDDSAVGVKGFLYEGCDVVTMLRDMLQAMGILGQ
jgi:methylmalonyl-CoA mutase